MSGCLGVHPATKVLGEDIKAQTVQALNNLRAIVTESGSSIQDVVKTTIYLTDLNDFATVNGIYSAFFSEQCPVGAILPARTTIQISKLPLGASIEIEAIVKNAS